MGASVKHAAAGLCGAVGVKEVQSSVKSGSKLIATIVVTIVLVFSGLFGLVVVVVGGVNVYEGIVYDVGDPEFSRWQLELDKRLISLDDGKGIEPLDLTNLRSGDWVRVCAVGGYNNPIEVAEENGALVSATDRQKLEDKLVGFRLSIVEEFEFMLVIVRSSRQAEFMHFPSGIGSAGQHFLKCVAKPNTKLAFYES